VPEPFVKFPRTPHLAWLGPGAPRGDKLLAEEAAAALLVRPLSVEEKIDGAGIGFSVGEHGDITAQSRGSVLVPGMQRQYQPLWRWIAEHEERLRTGLGARRILFGEWCYAKHSVSYDRLPDWFIAFDIYDRDTRRFWSRTRRDPFAAKLGLSVPPLLAEGHFSLDDLQRLMGPSRFGSEPMEGMYLRADDGEWLVARAKLVRETWVQVDDEHWSRRPLMANRLDVARRAETRGVDR